MRGQIPIPAGISLLSSQAWLPLPHPGAEDAPTRLGFNPWGHSQSSAPAWSRLTLELPFPKLQELLCPSPFPMVLPFHVMSSGVAQWMLEKLASHGNSPRQPECCARTTFGTFLTDLVSHFRFLLKPESVVASAEGTGTFPERGGAFPGIPCSQTRTLPLGTALQAWEVTASGSSPWRSPTDLLA